MPGPRQVNGRRRRLRAGDPVGMVVGDGGAALGVVEDVLQPVERVPDCRNAHRCPVAPAAIRPAIAGLRPEQEAQAVARTWIRGHVAMERVDVAAAVQHTARNGERQYRIVREARLGDEQLEVGGPGAGVFVHRPDHVACNRSQHRISSRASSGERRPGVSVRRRTLAAFSPHGGDETAGDNGRTRG